jgi:AcrR family transcriptional regulator
MSATRQAAPEPASPPAPAAHPGHGRPAKRQAIVGAALRAFLRNGFGDTSMDAIAAEAGVAKQTIYGHFGDKERLFAEVVRRAQAEAGAGPAARLEQALANSDDLEAGLRAAGRNWVRGVLRPDVAGLRRLILTEAGRHPWLREEWARPRPEFELALARAIEAQARRGRLDVPDARLAARRLSLVVITAAVTRALYGLRQLSDTEIGEIVDDGVEMWMRCYAPRPRRDRPGS